MPYVTTPDDTRLYVRDWGQGRPVVLIHGWPLNGDAWEYQAVTLAEAGYRVIAYDRRGFGKSDQPFTGYDYDTFADDLKAVIDALSLRDIGLAGFSMGGGEVARYMSRHEGKGVVQTMLIASVVPYILKTDTNTEGVPEDALEDMKDSLRRDRPGFLAEFFKGFYGQSLISGVSDQILNWSMMMAMQASPKATLDCIDAFGKTDFRGDLPAFRVPTMIVHGAADKIVPIDPTARAAARGIPGAALLEYEGGPHGLPATHGPELLADMMDFLQA